MAPEFDPSRPVRVAPSILSADFSRLGEEIVPHWKIRVRTGFTSIRWMDISSPI